MKSSQKKIYEKVLNEVKDLNPIDFYNLLDCLEMGYKGYNYMDIDHDEDDIDEIEGELDD